jgi:prepilin-type N-terminal cleavage/methylation domain-containing protein
MEPIRHHRGPALRHLEGFTLIEMLVVLAIIITITAVIFAGQSNFSNTILLTSTAYDVALSMRDAETYGLGTRAQGGVANAGYGLDFSAATPTTYTLFADDYPPAGGTNACHTLPTNGASAPNAYPGDCVYGSGDAAVSTYTLGNGVTISNFCAAGSSGSWSCANSTTNKLTKLDIVFLRPNATPFISENGTYNAASAIARACITVSSGANSRYITLAASGQIIASATSCP